MDHLKHLGVFIAIADTGSLVGAARALNLSPPTVTRILSDLEAGLGVPLFHRTTRAVVLQTLDRPFWKTRVGSWRTMTTLSTMRAAPA